MTGSRVIRGWGVACAALLFGAALALAVLLVALAPAADAADCPNFDSVQVPGAELQNKYCLADLTTKSLVEGLHTEQVDWRGLHASGTRNPQRDIPGMQVNGYFPDTSNTNENNGYLHDAQFVIRMPNDWNGKLVITGAPGVRGQYALDFLFSDWLLARGYAFASTDKGNTGTAFYNDGTQPGDAVAEWHERVEELTIAAKATVNQRYNKALRRTYITGISNGGYLTRYALENNPELYDGGVDWEGTLFRENGPNLFTYLPASLKHYPECEAGDEAACRAMIQAGFQPGSQFLWDDHYTEYWDLTQRIYREEFDPEYDNDELGNDSPFGAGYPGCQDETSPPPPCDADYVYAERPQAVKDAVGEVSNTGNIGKPMLTLHGTLDALLPIRTDSNVYRDLIERAGDGRRHRYYKIEDGTHVDAYYDRPGYQDQLRPILPCHRAAFKELEEWVERRDAPPASKYVERPKKGGVVNRCVLGKEARYVAR